MFPYNKRLHKITPESDLRGEGFIRLLQPSDRIGKPICSPPLGKVDLRIYMLREKEDQAESYSGRVKPAPTRKNKGLLLGR